jgi:hypothetical protein
VAARLGERRGGADSRPRAVARRAVGQILEAVAVGQCAAQQPARLVEPQLVAPAVLRRRPLDVRDPLPVVVVAPPSLIPSASAPNPAARATRAGSRRNAASRSSRSRSRAPSGELTARRRG